MHTPAFLTRFAREIGDARRNRRNANLLSALPRDIQKDIGWPAPDGRVPARTNNALLRLVP